MTTNQNTSSLFIPGQESCTICPRTQSTHAGLAFHKTPAGAVCDHCVQTLAEQRKTDIPTMVKAELGENLPSARQIFDWMTQDVIGQDAAKRTLAIALREHAKRVALLEKTGSSVMPDTGVELKKRNVLIIGPTGTGKTHMAETMAKLVDIPFVDFSAPELVEQGYVGQHVEDIASALVRKAEGDLDKAQRGIVFLDEIDKKRIREAAGKDVNGEGGQDALLKPLDGGTVTVKIGNQEKSFSFRNVLFICGGAFAGLEQVIADRLTNEADDGSAAIGFGGTPKSEREIKANAALIHQVHPKDLTDYGLKPELIGRLHTIATLDEMDEDLLVRILTEPTNAVTKQLQTTFGLDDTELTFTEAGLRAIAVGALKRKTGARGLDTLLSTLLEDVMFELGGDTTTVVVDADASGNVTVNSKA